MCAHWKLKTRSKNIEVVMSSGRVTDTSSAETNLASHLTSCAWRLEQVSKLLSLLLPERESSRKSAETVVQDHGAVRTVGLATSGAAAGPRVVGCREDACSISAVGDNGVSSGGCRDAVSSDVYEEMCA